MPENVTLRGHGSIDDAPVKYNLIIYFEKRNAIPKITGKISPAGVYGSPPQVLTLQDGRLAYFHWTGGESVIVTSLSPKTPK